MNSDQAIYRAILDHERRGEPAVLVTVIRVTGSAPRKEGAKMLVAADRRIVGTVGGAMLEALAIETAMDVLRAGTPRSESHSLNDPGGRDTNMICGGTVELFYEPVASAPWLYMFGAGHCGRAIAAAAIRAGFHAVVIDARPEFANRDQFPDADEVLCGHPQEVARSIAWRRNPYVVVATHCYAQDLETTIAVLDRIMPAYLGVIGSRKKRIDLTSVLERTASSEAIARIRMPMGIDIGAETPEEIAVSVVAEMIRLRRTARTDERFHFGSEKV